MADLIEALSGVCEPVRGFIGGEKNGSLHMIGGSLLNFGALGLVGDGVDGTQVRVGGHRRKDVGASAGEKIHHAPGEVTNGEDFAKEDGGVGLTVRSEGDDGISAGDGGKDHREKAEKRGFLGGKDADHAHGLHDGEIEVRCGNGVHAAEEGLVFVGPTRVMNRSVDRSTDFARGGCIRLGEQNGGGEFVGAGFEHFRDAIEDLTAIVGAPFRPTRSGLRSGFDGIAEILTGAERDVANERARGVVERINAPTLGADECSADEAFRGFGNGKSAHGFSGSKGLTTEDTESTEGEEIHEGKQPSPCPLCSLWSISSNGFSNNLGVVEEALFAAFAAEAGFLVAAEGTGGVEFVVGVRPDDTGFEFGGHF